MGHTAVLRSLRCTLALSITSALSAQATFVQVDLSGLSTGNYLDGGGADFTQTFTGQTASNNVLSGQPSSPLSLLPSGSLTIGNYSGENSILPTPGNIGPLCMLLDEDAQTLRWHMGHATSGSTVDVDFYSAAGALVDSKQVTMLDGYNDYELADLPSFRGLAFHNNNDGAGVRFMRFEYEPLGSLQADVNQLSLATGGQQHLQLFAPAELAGETYLVLGTLSGTSPGSQLGPNVWLPLNVDSYLIQTLMSPNAGTLQLSLGALSVPNAQADCWVTIPAGLPPGLIGLTMHHAYVVITLTPTLLDVPYASPAQPLLFLP